MPGRVDISGGSKPKETDAKGKARDKDGAAPSSGNAVKLAIVAVCFVLAGGVVYWNFLRQPPPPPPQPSFNPMEHMTPEEQKVEQRRMEIEERDLKKRPPAGA